MIRCVDGEEVSLEYRDAGVDIDRANRLIQRIKPIAERTRRRGVLAGVGGFGALFQVPLEDYRHPVLVSGTDGVGTKLRLAIDNDAHQGIGIDVVAMCANDVLAHGAEPLYFLDYFATGRLDVAVAERVIDGIARGCELAGAALVGGETAEMPGLYVEGDYDLAGFCVGIVERDRVIDGRGVRRGDALIALASSGPHANGYSLVRRVLEHSGADPDACVGGRSLREALLEPTRIYVAPVLELIRAHPVRAIAHITGGGLPGNIPRVLPEHTLARIDRGSWSLPEVFGWLQRAGNIRDAEMLRTFNCGVGMVLAMPAEAAPAGLEQLRAAGESAWLIGRVERSERKAPEVVFE
ncbi:MAG: phosphoribosylformylglycinamidine cyclo-ligase [Gammaproteobacteria bacterium]|nr:phosphoribosylformylglycinamidine cyclo-ligase [Gammaproteobacteria bacterium]NIR84264.1 phosphoribosylformylglycinamidine cyclo-ligase [Gammaproteobacteria bacterium]NIR89734.1 phosphoribosylformylglycinamidine cyclo-ligase [Gammaproteobacteria bacterium]NIU05422.1 phosphoribosylformylglycinamidine cyclo-ligase [Gammaproteobacteria bacterium]NIV52368.1 phosphoribosylformylglycinamidine cyclo-ligase [Gammaproteobacteria bacterium]